MIKRFKEMSKVSKAAVFLLGLLVLTAFYYFVFYQPTKEQMYSLEKQIEKAETKKEALQQEQRKIDCLKEEISIGKKEKSRVYPYDNGAKELNALSNIMGAAKSYNIDFEEPFTEQLPYIRREARLVFDTDSYEQARAIIRNILHCKCRVLVKEILLQNTLNQEEMVYGVSEEPLSVTMELTFLEKTKDQKYPAGVIDHRTE